MCLTVKLYIKKYFRLQKLRAAYYIHLVPNVFDQIEKLNISSYEALLPEVPCED